MDSNKIFLFYSELDVINKHDWNHFNNATETIFKRTKDGKLKVILNFKKFLLPKLYFKVIEKVKNIDQTVSFNIVYDFSDLEKDHLFEYAIYFWENNIFDDKSIILNILKRKSGVFENNIFTIHYLNQNEEYILEKNKELFTNFFSSVGFNIESLLFNLDSSMQDLIFYKKEQENKNLLIHKQKNENSDASNFKNIEVKHKNYLKGDIIKISNLIPEMQTAIIEGEVFKLDAIKTRNGFVIYKFYISDFTDSIIVKAFPKEKGITREYLEHIKLGNWIKCKVNLQVDMYENNELTALASSLTIIDKPQSYNAIDDCEVKRVELINHTNMTAFEGLINVSELFEFANKLGHKFISITDKSNCQAFPETFAISKKFKNITPIYGVQLEKIENSIPIVINADDRDILKSEYVVFDLETTGLIPNFNKIIEFGGIKYQNGKIVDTVQFFINPEIPLPDKIVNITKITNQDVEKGLNIKEALVKIKSFFGNSVLIAHNGIKFDLPFINAKMIENGFEPINNPLIDTMQISRSINEIISGHSLGAICRRYKINYDENVAHRADVDSRYLLDVWKKFQNICSAYHSIKTLNDLNQKLQNDLILERNRGSYITIYCKKNEYIKKLYELISFSLTKNYYNGAKIFEKEINKFRKFFLISNSPTEGDVLDKAFSGTQEELENAISFYDFITIAPISCFNHDIHRGVCTKEELEEAIKNIVKTANKLGKKVVASSDSYYLHKSDNSIFNVYVHTKSIGGKRHRFFKYNESNEIMPDLHYRTTQEMLHEMSFLGKKVAHEIVVDNTNYIAEMFEKNIEPIKQSLYSPSIEGSEEKLKKLIYDRANEIYGENINDYIKKRIDRETKAVISNGYAMVYWFSHLLVKKSIDDGYIVGSRGSVGSSLTAWLINITEVNPLPPHYLCKKCKHFEFVENCDSGFDLPNKKCPKCENEITGDGQNIPFETFMGFEGDKIPDIDLNFSALYQSKAHDFIRDMFGKDKVFRAGTIGTVAEKTAYGYVKAYFESINKTHVKNAEIIRIATRCENVKRTTGQHPGGIIVIPKEYDVYDFTPFNFPADDKTQDWYTTHFAFEWLHDSLLKFDILGHDNPTVLKMLSEKTGVNPDDIPNYDSDVMSLFSSTNSLNIKFPDVAEMLKVGSNGIPEFGTNFVKEMLLIIRPKKFSDLIRISGLAHGTYVWNDNAKNLIQDNGIKISEVISCRDDIMVNLIRKNIPSSDSFKIMEDVRKGKGLKEEYVKKLVDNNIPNWYIESCQKIKYLFPKAHAAAYVVMAWKIAWFKIYYPLHFYSSFFSIRSEVFDIETIVEGKSAIMIKLNDIKKRMSDAKTKAIVKQKEIDLIQIYEMALEMTSRGFSIKNIDLNKSQINEFIIEENSLIPPFSTIDGLGDAVATSIVQARNERPFVSKEDILKRTKITKTHFNILQKLGIISHLDDDDQLSLFD